MSAEAKILTDEQIRDIAVEVALHDQGGLARAIEQAVLQSDQVRAWKRDAGRCAEYQQLLEGAAAVLANSAEELEEGVPNECLAHEARSMAQTILFTLPNGTAAQEQKT